jgi:hypothetical protein
MSEIDLNILFSSILGVDGYEMGRFVGPTNDPLKRVKLVDMSHPILRSN